MLQINTLSGGGGDANTWTPASIETELWLDATRSSTITINAGVSNWADLSGNGYDVSQSDIIKQPGYVGSLLNGYSGVVFDGATDGIFRAIDTALGRNVSSLMIVCVCKPDTTSLEQRLFTIWTPTTNFIRCSIAVNRTTGNRFSTGGRRLDADGFQQIVGNTNFSTTTASIVVAAFDYTNTRLELFLNGVSDAVSTTFQTSGNTSDTDSNELHIGNASDSGSIWYDGQVFEVLLIHNDVSATTRQKLEGWAAHYFGLTDNLPSTHPYKTQRPTS